MRRHISRSSEAIAFARSQRKQANEFAFTVWQWLRNRQCCGMKFRREHPIPPYTADFCCLELKLIIEIDGQPHQTEDGIERDRIRDRFLTNLGYKILRIPGYEIIREDGNAYARIEQFVRRCLAACRMKSTQKLASQKRKMHRSFAHLLNRQNRCIYFNH